MAQTFDVVVIGGGPGGYVAAIRAAQLGLKTALVEKDERLGGTCLLRGCIPTKALLYTAELLAKVSRAGEFGIEVKEASLNWAGAQKRKDRIVQKGAAGIDFLMKKNKVTVIRGHGRLSGRGRVRVGGAGVLEELEAKAVVLATGSAPKSLPNVIVDHRRVLSSDSALELSQLPKSAIVLGGGAVGVEFASLFAHLGVETRVVELLPHLLPFEDEDSSKELEKHFRRRKIGLHLGARLEAVEVGSGGVKARLESPAGPEVLEAEILLSAVGRSPNTGDLGLEGTAIALEKGFIPTDSFMRTAEPGVYAIGDLVPTPMLAHVASAEGIVAVEHIAGRDPPPLNYERMPSATYSYPEVASVGLSEKKARERGFDVKTGVFPFSAITKAAISDDAVGMAKIVSEKKYDEVLGIHLVGPHATELLGEACVALRLEATCEDLSRTVHAHPTLSEIVREAAEAALGHPIHI